MTLFERQVHIIRLMTCEIASTANLSARLTENPIISARFDLNQSAKRLREAADQLESIANRSKDHAVQEG